MYTVALLMLKKTHHKLALRILKQRYLATRHYASTYPQQDAGFSLIEIIVVVLIVGILAAILGPNWLAFVNRQRVNKANDVILSALQQAQLEAKKNKRNYSVSFTTDNKVAKIAIYPSSADPSNYWHNLGGDLGIQSGQVVLGTNMTNNNVASSSISYNAAYDTTKPQTITFDYMGTLPNANFGTPANGSTDPPGLKILVAIPNGNSSTASNVKRCVIVQTLIGQIRTAKDTNCN